MSVNPTKLTRRQSFQLGAATTVAVLLTVKETTTLVQAEALPAAPATTPFVVPLPVITAKAEAINGLLPTAIENANIAGGECGRLPHQRWNEFLPQKLYTLKVRETMHSFHPELSTQKVWGYDGMIPGTTFVARYGVPIVVRIYNELPANSVGFGSPEISTHLHNLHNASESDGFADDYYSATKYGSTLTAPGAFKDHHYINVYAGYDDPRYRPTKGDPREALGTLWYHDHRVDFTSSNVYKGLSGFYLLFDEVDSGNELDTNPKALRLPSGVGKYDIPLNFQDKQFDASGYLYFDPLDVKGMLGDKFCVNGKVQPYFQVERRKYRFRLLNGSVARFYEFYLTNSKGLNQSFTYIANDGNLLPERLTTSKVYLATAERGDIVIDFANYPIGTKLYIVNRLIQIDAKGPEDESENKRGPDGLLIAPGTQIMRFDVDFESAAPDMSQVPVKLRALPPINLAEVVKTRTFKFNKSNGIWAVNGQLYDGTIATATPKRGTAEIWILQGSGNWHHPIHIHCEEGRILSHNGYPPPVHEMGRKDVFVLAPGDEIKVFIRFRDFSGKYMMHCHNQIHEDHAMMIRFDIID